MDKKLAISVHNVSKNFKLPHERYNSLKQSALHLFSKRSYSKFEALKDISFDVKDGEFFGIVGRNGSGKSTMLKILGGIYTPTKGKVVINGTLSPFIELGVGFNPELSGRDNVYLNGAILGLTRKQVDAKYDEIVAFSELEDFMDQHLKNYSSGMQVRLAFSIAIQAQSDILLIDEVLAVGDSNFQTKCYNVFRQMKRDKRTIVFVSHDMNAIKDFCDRAALIHDGVVAAMGTPDRIINKYNQLNVVEAEDSEVASELAYDTTTRWGTGDASILRCETLSGEDKRRIFQPEQPLTVRIEAQAKASLSKPILGLVIKNAEGIRIFTTNTKLQGTSVPNLTPDEKITLNCIIPPILGNGTYTIAPAVADTDGKVIYDWIEDAASFEIRGYDTSDGIIQPRHTITVKKGS